MIEIIGYINKDEKPNSIVYQMDCLEGMKQYPDKYFDLAVVDPPYGINATNMNMGSHPTRSRNDGYGSGPGISTSVKLKGRLNSGASKLKNRALNQMNCDWDLNKPTDEYFKELFRISNNQIIWGGNYFNLPPTRCIICWDKMQPWDNFSQWEMAWTSFDKPAKLYKISNTGGANKEIKIHPTQKPIKLYNNIYKDFADDGMKILDTHLGSQSNRISANEYFLNFTGYELDYDYFNKGNDRFKNFYIQSKIMF